MKKSFTAKLWKLMKICAVHGIIAIMLCGVTLARTSYAQLLDKEISVTVTDMSFEKTLKEIERVADVKFAYSIDQLLQEPNVSLSVEKSSLRLVLEQLLTPRQIRYRVHEKERAITLAKVHEKGKGEPSLNEGTKTSTSDRSLVEVTGTVREASSRAPMSAVNVLIKGTTNGTTTDANGRYVIDANDSDVLVFSFIGYATVEENVNGRSVIDIALSEDVVSLKDVVINAGYWNISDREKTGNISRVTAEEIQRQPVSNPLAALTGRMPGVYVQQTTGLPGGGMNIQIRGVNSLRPEANDPLYLIDGVPFTASTLSSTNVGGEILPSANPLNNINPNDIESIEVLKDADATAIYGSRGANGVVLITTKRGRSGKTNLNIDFYRGFSNLARKMKLLNSSQYLRMRREAIANDQALATPVNAPDLLQWDTTRYTDWQKELIGGTASSTNLQASLSGGNENTQFFFSGGYYKETSLFPGDFSYRKGSAHLNLNHRSLDNKLNLVLSLSYSSDMNDLPRQDLTAQAVTLQPVAPSTYDDNGNLNWANGTWANPVASLLRRYESNSKNLISNTIISYQLIRNLVAKTSLGYTSVKFGEVQTNPRASYNPDGNFFSSSSWGDNEIVTWIVEPHLEYHKSISKGRVSILVGTTFQESNRQSHTFLATGFPSDALLSNIQSATTVTPTNWNSVEYRYNALFGRINVTWRDRYLVNLTGRRDGSSRFERSNQFANFGAAGLAWIFSEESFIRDRLSFFTFGKIRTSYGLTGNDQIPDYGYLETYSSSTYSYQGAGLYPTRLSNPDYGWESNRKFEAALDAGFVKDKIQVSVSYYNNRSSNQLVGYSLPATTGHSFIQANLAATVENSGWEFEVTARNSKDSDVGWSASLNFTIPENRLLAFPNIGSSSYANTYVVGKSLFVLKRVHSIGVDPETGIYKFEDVDGNGRGTDRPADVQALKEVTQKFYGGVRNLISYKGFELDLFLQFVSQTGRNYLNTYTSAPGSRLSNQPVIVMDRWQNAGQLSEIQMFTTKASTDAGSAYRNLIFESDGIVSDASFVRLKNVQLSYKFPLRWIEKVKLQDCKLYVQGQNVMTFTKYLGLDPENQLATALPPLRTLTVGMRITF